MQTIKKGKPQQKGFAGMEVTCSSCKEVFRLEKGDKVRNSKHHLGASGNFINCPNCDRLILLP